MNHGSILDVNVRKQQYLNTYESAQACSFLKQIFSYCQTVQAVSNPSSFS